MQWLPATRRHLQAGSWRKRKRPEQRDLGEWVREVGASKRTLTRLFPAQTGMSFRSWRQQRRLLRALELLASGHNVTVVAQELGYENTSAFISMFRRCLGETPARYLDTANDLCEQKIRDANQLPVVASLRGVWAEG